LIASRQTDPSPEQHASIYPVDKTRCSYYAQKALSRPGEKEFAPFVEWLAGAPVEAKPRPRTQQPIDTGGHPAGTQAAADYVAQQKIAAGRVEAAARVVPVPLVKKPWTNRGEMRRAFLAVREHLGEYQYLGELERSGVRSADDFRKTDEAEACYYRLVGLNSKQGVA